MKNNISDSLLEKTIEKMNELNEEALKELGFTVSDEEVDLSEDQEQQLIEFIIEKGVFAKGENLKNLWKAINDTDLVKVNELKSNIAEDEYVETLIIASLLNSGIRNNEIIKFLLTETEISEWSNLKAAMMLHFLDVENEAELNEEIIELLSIKNELGYQKALSNILSNRNISDDFFIKSFENSPDLDVNKPIIIQIKYGQDEAFHDEEYSLLTQSIQSNRFKLAEYLATKGAALFPNEVNSLLYNTNVSDGLLIKSFENSPNLDVNNPMIVKVCGLDRVFYDKEYSLLTQVIQSNRPALVQYLVDKGATLLPNPNEVHSLLDNTKVSDKFLINCLGNSSDLDVNKPIIIKIKYDQDEAFHDEERSLLIQSIQSNRPVLAQHLVDKGATLLLNEVNSLLYNTNVSDEFLIKSFENSPNLDVNNPMIVKVCRLDRVFYDKEYSLLTQVIQSNRPALVQYLVDKGAKLFPNPDEVNSLLYNTKVSDELLINCLENSPDLDVNKPMIIETYGPGRELHEREYSLLTQVIQSNRVKLVEYLVTKGATLFPNEVNSLLYNTNVSDELLIKSFENSPNLDVNKPMIIKVYGLDGTLQDGERSLLTQAIESKRLELVKYLVTKGANVNFSAQGTTKPYMETYYQGIKFFEALVDSGKLLKDEFMAHYNMNLDDQLTLNLSDLYDVITWKNNIQASLSKNILSFNKWLNNGKIHSLDNVLKAYQKFSNIKIDYLKDIPAIKQAQDKYAQGIIDQGQEVSEKIKKHFSDNWQQNMLVCKNFNVGSVFGTTELNRHIGEYLGWEVFKPLDQVPLTGAIEE